MLSDVEIRNVKFTKVARGYKQEEVEIILDRVEADYAQFGRTIKELQAKIDSLNKEVEGYKNSQSSLQNVLLSAQKLADQIVSEAKVKSDEIIKKAEDNITEITAHEKELTEAFELKAEERKTALQKDLDAMTDKAQKEADAITAAAKDSVAREQILFDKLKIEVASFKSAVSDKYREHLDLIKSIPDAVPMDPKRVSAAVSAVVDAEPNLNQCIAGQNEEDNSVEEEEEPENINNGFVVNDDIEEEDEKLATSKK